jgi:ABC-2 type transport system permease protein
VPRASPVIAYGLVGLAFLWELFGALLEVPGWLLALSPFHDVGLVPGEPFEPGAAAIMLALAAFAALAALWAFRRRDLSGA